MALLFKDPSDDNRKGKSNYWIFEECREPTVFERVTQPNLSGTTVMLSRGAGMYRGTQFDSLSAGDTIRVGRRPLRCTPVRYVPARDWLPVRDVCLCDVLL